jgi:hypothetical protein
MDLAIGGALLVLLFVLFRPRSRRVYMPPSTKVVLNTEYGSLAARVARIEAELGLGLNPFPFQAAEVIDTPATGNPPLEIIGPTSGESEIARHEFRSDLPPRA